MPAAVGMVAAVRSHALPAIKKPMLLAGHITMTPMHLLHHSSMHDIAHLVCILHVLQL
jgi:hypothetical protein